MKQSTKALKRHYTAGGLFGGAFILLLGIFMLLASLVTNGVTQPWDSSVLLQIHSYANPLLDWLAIGITFFGAGGAVIVAMIVTALLLRKKMYRQVVLVMVPFIGATVSSHFLKLLFERARPSLWNTIVVEPGLSFPSGHAMTSLAMFLSFMIIAWSTRWRWPAVIGGAVMIALIGLTRLYIGVHNPTDILAGWCASALWVIATVAGIHIWQHTLGKR